MRRPGRVGVYYEEELPTTPCFRCGATPSAYTWTICSDGNRYRPICLPCDIALQEVVLLFMGFKNWRSKLERYKARVAAEGPAGGGCPSGAGESRRAMGGG